MRLQFKSKLKKYEYLNGAELSAHSVSSALYYLYMKSGKRHSMYELKEALKVNKIIVYYL